MKKTPCRTLRLSKETVKPLSPEALTQAAGGLLHTQLYSCAPSCMCTRKFTCIGC